VGYIGAAMGELEDASASNKSYNVAGPEWGFIVQGRLKDQYP
jgi:hypothetical protein